MKKILFASFILVFCFAAANSAAFAQSETATVADLEKELELLRRDLRADKKKIIALNVPLTEAEAAKFWPVYDQYTDDMRKHNDAFYALIKDYAANQKTITDQQAISLLNRWSNIQVEMAQTRKKYIPLIEKTIPGKKAALFFQIDRRLYALMDIQVTSQIPLLTK